MTPDRHHPTAAQARIRVLAGGGSAGRYLRLTAPISIWGGVDPQTGTITDRNHPQDGLSLTGRAVHLSASRGSSSSSSVLLECVRLNTAPAIFLIDNPDLILTIGATAAWSIYQRGPTVGLIEKQIRAVDGDIIQCRIDGTVLIEKQRKVARTRPHN